MGNAGRSTEWDGRGRSGKRSRSSSAMFFLARLRGLVAAHGEFLLRLVLASLLNFFLSLVLFHRRNTELIDNVSLPYPTLGDVSPLAALLPAGLHLRERSTSEDVRSVAGPLAPALLPRLLIRPLPPHEVSLSLAVSPSGTSSTRVPCRRCSRRAPLC